MALTRPGSVPSCGFLQVLLANLSGISQKDARCGFHQINMATRTQGNHRFLNSSLKAPQPRFLLQLR